jgi:carotenoid cleavage dioxygenase
LLALEEAHLPMEIEPGTLKTRGYVDTTAPSPARSQHPKVDPLTGELMFFATTPRALSAALSYGSINARARHALRAIETPYASMVHDFIVTDNHACCRSALDWQHGARDERPAALCRSRTRAMSA